MINRITKYSALDDGGKLNLACELIDTHRLLAAIVLQDWRGTKWDVKFHKHCVDSALEAHRYAQSLLCEGK